MHWGLGTSGKCSRQIINARSGTLSGKATFRSLLSSRRCVVLADGFYEWKTVKNGKKQPFYFKLPDGLILTMAGLYNIFHTEDGQPRFSFTIITVPACQTVSCVHERMPAILSHDAIDTWIDSDVPVAKAFSLLRTYDAELLSHPVSTFVSFASNEGPQCIAKIELPDEAEDKRKAIQNFFLPRSKKIKLDADTPANAEMHRENPPQIKNEEESCSPEIKQEKDAQENNPI